MKHFLCMKRGMLAAILATVCIVAKAQQEGHAFRAYLYNNIYEVYMDIDLYQQRVSVPGHELYGDVAGYLGKKHNSFCWVIASSQVKSEHQARLQMINDFGSEDLEATLIRKNDTLYVLRQEHGSPLKMPIKNKWQKMPRELELIRK